MFWRTGRSYTYRRKVGEGDNYCRTFILFIVGTLFFVGIPILSYSVENEYFQMSLAFGEAEEALVSLPSDKNPQSTHIGDLVHIQSQDIIPSSILADADFNLAAPDALKMKRVVEYCQWVETRTESSRRENDEEVVTVTFHYSKLWNSRPIPSIFFDQPFGHNNPQAYPFYDVNWVTESASLGDFTINSEIVNSISSFRTKIWDGKELQNFVDSQASKEENFHYVGDGYFYYSYEKSNWGILASMAGQWIDGSLLDFQLVDIIPQCTAGDIRSHFKTIEPTEVSAIGYQQNLGELVGWKASNGYVVAALREGTLEPKELLDAILTEYLHWTVWGVRALLILWAIVIMVINFPKEAFMFYLVAGPGFTLLGLGFIWFVIHPTIFSGFLTIGFLVSIIYIAKMSFYKDGEKTHYQNGSVDTKTNINLIKSPGISLTKMG